MTPMPDNTPSTSSGSPSAAGSGRGLPGSVYTGVPLDQHNRLDWLTLQTRPTLVVQSLRMLFNRALEEDRDARRAGTFLLSLWSPEKYPLDIEDISFFDRELNYAARHMLNFFIACQVRMRTVVTYREMEPVITAWGQPEEQN